MKSNAALTASAIKNELKEYFPKVRFSVRSHGCNCVRVSWTDFATAASIEHIVGKYEMGHFDGMTDSYEYTNRRDDIPQVQYVFTEQHISPEYARLLLARIKSITPYILPLTVEVREKIWRDGSIGWELSEDYCGDRVNIYTLIRNMASYYVYLDGVLARISNEDEIPYHAAHNIIKRDSE